MKLPFRIEFKIELLFASQQFLSKYPLTTTLAPPTSNNNNHYHHIPLFFFHFIRQPPPPISFNNNTIPHPVSHLGKPVGGTRERLSEVAD